ncbi:MAG: hypothetical protein ACJ73E_18070 [Mycobacteriales bacterium]
MSRSARRKSLALHLVSQMAEREAEALTLIPELRLQTERPQPEILFKVLSCPWCGRGTPPPAPLREVAFRDGATVGSPRSLPHLPQVSVLWCEELTARSLLPLSLRRLGDGPTRLRFSTRAAFWARFVGTDRPSRDDTIRGLTMLDLREAWLDDLARAFGGGEGRPVTARGKAELVLPACTRRARSGDQAWRTDDAAAPRRTLHFLTSHLEGGAVARLNDVYLAARMRAVADRLRAADRPGTPI